VDPDQLHELERFVEISEYQSTGQNAESDVEAKYREIPRPVDLRFAQSEQEVLDSFVVPGRNWLEVRPLGQVGRSSLTSSRRMPIDRQVITCQHGRTGKAQLPEWA
jgi:hypothetical protein